MELTDFTTYAEVRSSVGMSMSSVELPDSVLSLEIYKNRLELFLNGVSLPDEAPGPGPLVTRFLAIKATAESTRTQKEQELYNLTRLLSTYVVALEVAMSLSLRTPKSITDSKTSLTRFSPESTYENVVANLKEKVAEVKGAIENINVSDSVSDLAVGLYVVEPDIDVITGVEPE